MIVQDYIAASEANRKVGQLHWAVDYAVQAWKAARTPEEVIETGNQLAKVAEEFRRRYT